MNRSVSFLAWLLLCLCLWPLAALAAPPDPAQLIQNVVDYWRGKTSYTEVAMIIHRHDWERSLSMSSLCQDNCRL